MIVPGLEPTQAEEQRPDWYGWAVKLKLDGGGRAGIKNPPPHLILEHCTVEDAGLIDLTNNSAPSPVGVEVNHCAVKAKALLACRPGTLLSQVRWRGMGNQYDISGRVWIVLSASEGTPADLERRH